MLPYAARKKNFKKKFQKKISKKNFKKKISKNVREVFLGYLSSAANLSYACKNVGGLGPLVWA
jgi:hypothetical protein